MQTPTLTILEGNVGVGKTTLLKSIQKLDNPNTWYIDENYLEQCPYLKQLYNATDTEQIKKLSISCQIWILEKTISNMILVRSLIREGKNVVMDRSIFGILPFIQAAATEDIMESDWIWSIYSLIRFSLGYLEGIKVNYVQLYCNNEILVSRIAKRSNHITTPNNRQADLAVNLESKKIHILSQNYQSLYIYIQKNSNFDKVRIIDTTYTTPEQLLNEYLIKIN